jgi:hypothetical protein
MAEPKKETVRISLPRTPMPPSRRLPPNIAPTPVADATMETPTLMPDASALLQPMPKPPGTPDMPASINRGPRNETARISILPRPVGGAQAPPVVITSSPVAPVEAIPRPLCWLLLGISTAIFLIQIWNYVVS